MSFGPLVHLVALRLLRLVCLSLLKFTAQIILGDVGWTGFLQWASFDVRPVQDTPVQATPSWEKYCFTEDPYIIVNYLIVWFGSQIAFVTIEKGADSLN